VKGKIEANAAESVACEQPPLRVELRLDETPGETPSTDRHPALGESRALRALVLGAVLVIAGVYAGVHMGRGWVPADDGTLGQSALRVLQGQLPHRDFGEIYTGGLSLIHATAFRLFGVNLMSLRICVFLFFLAWIPAVYWIGLRFTSAIAAGTITLVAVAWSYPNYPAAMPSWYNLFFATFGAAALLRYLEVRARRWLLIAGVCGGVSILIKIIGAYYIAGAMLFLCYLGQSDVEGGDRSESNWIYQILSGSALLLFLATIVLLLHARLGVSEFYEFLLPSTSVVGLILLGERGVRAGTRQRLRNLFWSTLPFAIGVSIPLFAFLLPYVRSGGIANLLFGVGSSAAARSVDLAVIRPVGPQAALFYSVPLLILLAAAMYWNRFQGIAVGTAIGMGALVIVYRSTQSIEVTSGVFCSVAALTPLVAIVGAVIVFTNKGHDGRTRIQRQQVVMLTSLAATCSLVQYPFSAPIYLSYSVPLTLLALVAIVVVSKKQRATYVLASVLGFYLLFGVVTLVPHHIYELTHVIRHMDAMSSPRSGGLQIEGATFFDKLAQFLRLHSSNGKMFAGNDCPELYFLSGLQSVTQNDGAVTPEEALKAIRSDDLHLVVINDGPFFPGARMSPEVRAEVEKRFPNTERFGIFEVFWKQ
jgi:hypothetical protein